MNVPTFSPSRAGKPRTRTCFSFSWTRREKLKAMGYALDVKKYTSGPINAIFFDWKHGTFWGGSSNFGDDYGIAW
jgi:hypothetical protein